MTFVPENNTVAFGLLSKEDAYILQGCKYGWQVYTHNDTWVSVKKPVWNLVSIYRAVPFVRLSRIEQVGEDGFFTASFDVEDHYDAIEVHGINYEECSKRAEMIIKGMNKEYNA